MNKLLKSKKALSPVVAAIILIAVTVAVSIAVAVWMGSLTFNFMDTEPLTITRVTFSGTNVIDATVVNTGTTNVLINAATVTGLNATGKTITITGNSVTVTNDGSEIQVQLTISSGSWSAGNLYTIEIISSKGNKYTYTETAG